MSFKNCVYQFTKNRTIEECYRIIHNALKIIISLPEPTVENKCVKIIDKCRLHLVIKNITVVELKSYTKHTSYYMVLNTLG